METVIKLTDYREFNKLSEEQNNGRTDKIKDREDGR